jgi:hypothetical protein
MANPDLEEFDYAAPTWVNNENNWRAEDVQFILNRSVLKFQDEAAATDWFEGQVPPANLTGSLVFISGDADSDIDNGIGTDPYFVGYFSNVPTPVTRRLLASKYLRTPTAIDTSTSVTLRHSVDTGGGVSIASSGTVTAESTFKVGSRVTVSAGVVTLNDASTGTGTLQLSSGILTSSARFSCAGLNSSANSTITGTLATTSTLTVSSGGALITGNSTITGTLQVTSTFDATTSVTSPIVTAGNSRLTNTGLSAVSGGASVQLADSGASVNVISPSGFKFKNAPTEVLTKVAGVVISTSPSATPTGTYPEGTIWLAVSV